jgi:hypothetical protein
VTAAVMALDSYPGGPVDAGRTKRAGCAMPQFLGAPIFSVPSMFAS